MKMGSNQSAFVGCNKGHLTLLRPRLAALLFIAIICASRSWSEEKPPSIIDPISLSLESSEIVPAQGKEKKDTPVVPKVEPVPKDFNLFAQAPVALGAAPLGRNPRMIGDFPGYFSVQTYYVPSVQTTTSYQYVTTYQTVTTTTLTTQTQNVTVTDPMGEATFTVPVTVTVPVTTTTQVPVTTKVAQTTQTTTLSKTVIVIPQALRGPFKIAENESAHPEDRIYLTYNYFNKLQGASGAPYSSTSSQQTTINGEAATITTTVPGVQSPQFNMHRQVFGIEKLILDGRSSIGVRVPLIQQLNGDGSYGPNDIGDLSVIFKRAFYGELTGNLISGGLVVTVPTGPTIETYAGNFREFLIQPFFGGRYVLDRLTTQGFVSLAVPTDTRDVTVFFGDLSVGYNIYRAEPTDFLSFITPTVEAHLTTPLNRRTGTNPIMISDMLAITAGMHFGIYERSTLTAAMSIPVTGPRLFNIEAMAYLNYNY